MSFMILAVGSLAEWRTLPGFEIVVVLATGGAILLSCLSLGFARRAMGQAAALAAVAQNQTPPNQKMEPARPGE